MGGSQRLHMEQPAVEQKIVRKSSGENSFRQVITVDFRCFLHFRNSVLEKENIVTFFKSFGSYKMFFYYKKKFVLQGCGVEGEKVRALLVGEGQGGELLQQLEEAISRGDHR